MQTVAYPLAFGHWSVQGRQLVCRLPRRTVAVSAPGRLLRAVLRLCDGRLSWREVAASLAEDWSASAVEAFLGRLAHEGVLVEAGEALARWTELGQVPSLTGRAASAAELADLHRVAQARLLAGKGLAADPAALLADVLRNRQSDRTFADAALSTRDLCSVLWAAHGVARPSSDAALGWHRTVASGGNMHGARWFVFVLRDLPGEATSPGLYEARFHLEGGASLERLDAEVREAWRLLLDPRVLRYASALVLPLFDNEVPARKYGNRAALFAHVEAGQSLQNAQLMATALGSGSIVRGDSPAAAVLAALRPWLGAPVHHWLPMPALVLGAKARAEELARCQQGEWLQVGPAVTAGKGFAFFAGPVRVGDTQLYANGRGADPRMALRKAEAEAWERHAWATLGSTVSGRLRDVEDAMAPESIVAYTPGQYAAPGFPLRPFSPRRTYLWIDAQQVGTARRVRVPAECVHALDALPPAFRRHAFTNTSTSGLAAWTDAEGALCRATLELIERDAFLRCWLSRAGPPLLRPESLPQALQVRVRALAADGHRVALAAVAQEPVPVLSVFVQHLQRPFTAITAAADFDAEAALAKALDEAEGRAAHAAAFPARPIARAADVNGTGDVNRYYQTRRFHRRADFYAASGLRVEFASPQRSSWSRVQHWLAERHLDLLAVDLTPPGASLDQGRTPLKVVRAIVPGLIPIWFQHGLQPAGLPSFVAAQASATRGNARFIHPFT